MLHPRLSLAPPVLEPDFRLVVGVVPAGEDEHSKVEVPGVENNEGVQKNATYTTGVWHGSLGTGTVVVRFTACNHNKVIFADIWFRTEYKSRSNSG